jgi:hypothetical protein
MSEPSWLMPKSRRYGSRVKVVRGLLCVGEVRRALLNHSLTVSMRGTRVARTRAQVVDSYGTSCRVFDVYVMDL